MKKAKTFTIRPGVKKATLQGELNELAKKEKMNFNKYVVHVLSVHVKKKTRCQN